MPDTKSGRERKGLNKRHQLETKIVSRDASMDEESEPPTPNSVDSEFLADPDDVPDDGNLLADDD